MSNGHTTPARSPRTPQSQVHERAQVLTRLVQQQISQQEAARLLGVGERQVRRLRDTYLAHGAAGLVSQHGQHPSNHQLAPDLKTQALVLIRQHYPDFGPTLAHEKLVERHGLVLSVESVRQLMITDGLWQPRRAKHAAVHPLRPRRPCLGELVQIDGSPHAWFEDRAPVCTLLVFIDDATGQLQELYFTLAETTQSYFAATERYLRQHGRPLAFYSDKHSIFRVNQTTALTGSGLTQFGRALHELDIELICANTPQAKGRVERSNQTLQDRLVKELRLEGITDLDHANAYLPTFRAAFNRRFAVQPLQPHDLHRPLGPAHDLARILCVQEPRTLSKNLTFQYNSCIYQVQTSRPGYALRNATVLVRETATGEISVDYCGSPLVVTAVQQYVRQAAVVTSKELAALPAAPVAHAPAPTHPWRRYGTPLSRTPIPDP